MLAKLFRNLALLCEINLEETIKKVEVQQSQLDEVTTNLAAETAQENAFIAEVTGKIGQIQAAAAAAQANDQTLQSEIASLQAQVNAAGTPVDLSAINAAINANTSNLQALQTTIDALPIPAAQATKTA